MAFRAVLHGYFSPEQKQNTLKVLSQFRVEKAAKYLKEAGVTDDAIQSCIKRELSQRGATMAS